MKNFLHNSHFDSLCLYNKTELTELHAMLNQLDNALTEANVYYEMKEIALSCTTVSPDNPKFDNIRKETLELLLKEKENFSASVAKVLKMLDENIQKLS